MKPEGMRNALLGTLTSRRQSLVAQIGNPKEEMGLEMTLTDSLILRTSACKYNTQCIGLEPARLRAEPTTYLNYL